MKNKILMIVASNGYRDEEFDTPKEIFEKNGFDITVASTNTQKAFGKLGGSIKPDILIDDVFADQYDAVVFVGGPGTDEYFDNAKAHDIALETCSKGKIISAICIAPVVLANAGVLRNKKATVYPTGKEQIEAKGAIYTSERVSSDGNIVTADGPESAIDFAQTIVSMLNS